MEKDSKTIIGLFCIIATTILGGMGISYFDKRKTEKHEENMPDSYWQSKAEQKRIEAQNELDMAKLKAENHQKEIQARHDFEKSMPSEYWAYKASKEQSDAQKYMSLQEKRAKEAQAREAAEAFRSFVNDIKK